MAQKVKTNPQAVMFWLTFAGLAVHVKAALDHQKTCPQCRGKDLLVIALDVVHLWGLAG
jgi:hypothetical protein